MKTLDTIQKLAKVGKIFSKIVYVVSMIGAIGSLVGIVLMAVMGEDAIVTGSDTLKAMGEEVEMPGMPLLYASCGISMAFCAAEAVIARFAEKYFTNELADGTPFTQRGAKELMRLGIIDIAVSAGVSVVAGIVVSVASQLASEMEGYDMQGMSFGVGIAMIVVSLLCRLGAELTEGKEASAPEAPAEAPVDAAAEAPAAE